MCYVCPYMCVIYVYMCYVCMLFMCYVLYTYIRINVGMHVCVIYVCMCSVLCTYTRMYTRKTEEKLDGRNKEGHERKKPK